MGELLHSERWRVCVFGLATIVEVVGEIFPVGLAGVAGVADGEYGANRDTDGDTSPTLRRSRPPQTPTTLSPSPPTGTATPLRTMRRPRLVPTRVTRTQPGLNLPNPAP